MALGLYISMVLLFALWATIHLLLCFQLARHSVARAVLGFLLPPLAIYYAQHFAVGKMSSAWVLSLSCYLVTLTAAFIE